MRSREFVLRIAERFRIGLFASCLLFCFAAPIVISGCHRAQADEAGRSEVPRTSESVSEPIPEPGSTDEPGIVVVATGDVLIHQRVARAAELHASEGGYDWLFTDLARSIGTDEIAYLNLETPLSRSFRDLSSTTPPVLGAVPEVAQALSRAGIDVVGVANNHAYDQGAGGFRATLEASRGAGLAAIGGGSDPDNAYAPVFVLRGSVRTAFLAATDRLNASPERWDPTVRVARTQDDARLSAAIVRARNEADLVVLAVHWGEEFATRPTRAQEAAARRWLDQGVDLILGTGPHVLLPVERVPTPRGDGIIAYSLGNAISNQGLKYRAGHAPPGLEGAHEESPLPRDSVLLRIAIDIPSPGRIHIRAVTGEALWTENNWRRRWTDHTEIIRIRRLRDCDAAIRDERFAAIARALGPAVALSP